jgi:hypothetical protein
MALPFAESIVEAAGVDWLKNLGSTVRQNPGIVRSEFAALRDTLLPKLISGELRVQDAQRFVGGVDSMDEVDSGRA